MSEVMSYAYLWTSHVDLIKRLFGVIPLLLLWLLPSHESMAICEDPVIKYDPPYCPAGFEHMPTDNCQCEPGCCVINCEAQCVPLPEPTSCDQPLCEVPYLLDDCPVGEELVGESCACWMMNGECSKSCTPICEVPNPDPDPEPDPMPESDLIPEPAAEVSEPMIPIEGRLGSFDVNQGQFLYTIPLLGTGKGTNGMQPALALNYSSNSAPSILGLGWQLSGGMSAISRCGQTRALDGQVRGVDFSLADRFCLDGNRLMLVSGEYGKSGSEYRFEFDNLAKVKAVGDELLSFEVWYPNGSRGYYGNTEDSRVVVNKNDMDVARLWGRSRVEDAHENWMDFRYVGNGITNDLLLVGIDYTGHGEDQDPYNRVELEYELRPNPQTLYQSGIAIRKISRLKVIKMVERDQVIRGYYLKYDAKADEDKRTSQLISIDQCYGPAQTYCSGDTTFTWNNENVSGVVYDEANAIDWVETFVGSDASDAAVSHYNHKGRSISAIHVGDFDGNGKMDLYVFNASTEEGVNLDEIDSPVDPEVKDDIYLTIFNEDTQSYEYRLMPGLSWEQRPFEPTVENINQLIRVMDINGDGRMDIYVKSVKWEEESIWDQMYFSNLPVDGLTAEGELYEDESFIAHRGVKPVNSVADHMKTRLIFADYNGDRQVDLHLSVRYEFPLSHEVNFICLWRKEVGTIGGYVDLGEETWEVCTSPFPDIVTPDLFADGFNLDGFLLGARTRVDVFNSSSWSVYRNPRDPFNKSLQGNRNGPVSTQHIGDFNGDGIMDVYFMRHGPDVEASQDWLFFGSSNGFEKVIVSGIGMDDLGFFPLSLEQSIFNETVQVGDFNGDGLADLYEFNVGTEVSETNQEGINYPDKIYLSKGDGSFRKIDETFDIDLGWNADYFSDDLGGDKLRRKLQGARLIDVDGDGLTDLYEVSENNIDQDRIHYWRGFGNSYSKVDQAFGTVANPDDLKTNQLNVSQVRYTDINGDGLLDLYVMQGDGDKVADKVIFNQTIQPKIIKVSHEQGIGGEVSVTYDRINNPSVYESNLDELEELDLADNRYVKLAGGLSVVREVKSTIMENSEQGVRYFYKGARADKERGLLGFRQITQESFNTALEMDFMRNTTTYHQEYPYTGLVEESKVERLVNEYNPQEVLISETTNTWSELPGIDLGKRKVLVLTKSESQSYHPDSGKPLSFGVSETLDWVVNSEHEYWFSKQKKDWVYLGKGDELLHHRRLVEMDYKNVPSLWRVGLVKEVKQWIDVDDELGGAEEKYTRQYMEYDANHRLNDVDYYYDQDGEEVKLLTELYTWDTYGNLTRQESYGEGVPYAERRIVHTEYTAEGEVDGRYGMNVRNVYDHIQRVEVRDELYGVPLQIADSNDRKVAFKLGTAGDVLKSWDEEGSWSTIGLEWCENDCAYGSMFRKTSRSSSSPDRLDMGYYDAWGRPLGSHRYSPDSGDLYTRVEYDKLGRVKRLWGPKWDNPVESNNGLTVDNQWKHYDDLNRMTQIKGYGKNVSLMHTYEYDTEWDEELNQLLTVFKVKENGTILKKATYQNALGQTMKVIDYKGDEEIVLRYEYDVLGNLTKLWPEGESEAYVRTWTYDELGRKTEQTDSSLGAWSYEYNGLGQVVSQTDAKGQVKTMEYDRLGRPTLSVDDDGTTSFQYDTKQLGALDWVSRSYAGVSDIQQYHQEYNYDAQGRVKESIMTLDGIPYVTGYGYDAEGRPQSMSYPDAGFNEKFGITYEYGDLGQITQINKQVTPNDPAVVYWQLDTNSLHGGLDEYSRIHSERLGDVKGLAQDYIYRTYDYFDGKKGNQLKRIDSWLGEQDTMIQAMAFDYDEWGKQLKFRSDELLGVEESFDYDELDRLKYSSGTNAFNKAYYNYDKWGNLTLKDHTTGPYVMQYNNLNRPYLLTDAGSFKFEYDANGNLETKTIPDSPYPLREIKWNSHNRPKQITNQSINDTTEMYFVHDPFNNLLYKRYQQVNGETTTQLNLGLYQLIQEGEEWKQIYYIPGGSGGMALQRTVVNGEEKVEVLLKDHIGSIVGVQGFDDQASNPGFNYSPFGELRHEDWDWGVSWLDNTDHTKYGFAGQLSVYGEQEQLVSMGARFYDPDVGRFISADTIMYAPTSTQAINQYSYVHNNPLMLTDPSGHCPECPPEGWGSGYVLPELVIEGKRESAPQLRGAGDALARLELQKAIKKITMDIRISSYQPNYNVQSDSTRVQQVERITASDKLMFELIRKTGVPLSLIVNAPDEELPAYRVPIEKKYIGNPFAAFEDDINAFEYIDPSGPAKAISKVMIIKSFKALRSWVRRLLQRRPRNVTTSSGSSTDDFIRELEETSASDLFNQLDNIFTDISQEAHYMHTRRTRTLDQMFQNWDMSHVDGEVRFLDGRMGVEFRNIVGDFNTTDLLRAMNGYAMMLSNSWEVTVVIHTRNFPILNLVELQSHFVPGSIRRIAGTDDVIMGTIDLANIGY